ncbi:MAG: nitroreductase family protein [Rhodospirillaceae bacterium]|nr:nitroreductase family protein [Rhodospirillaceae bacterium]
MPEVVFEPLTTYEEYPADEMQARAENFYTDIKRRRTVRDYGERQAPRGVIENCIRAAGTAPSGANMQPWHFVVVENLETKCIIKQAAEEEEREFYNGRAPQAWLDALAHLGTDEHKPFLETAPYLIAVFAQSHSFNEKGEKVKHYYVPESAGIACGFLLAALHHAGLVTLTHTPSPMGFLNEILDRPKNEKPYMLIVAGYPAEKPTVPVITKKPLEEILSWK